MPSQIAVITGAGTGIGRAAARALGRAGFDIALIGRNEERLAEAVQDLHEHAIKTMTFALDVTSSEALRQAAEQIENELGPIAVWVNCAGSTVIGQVTSLCAQDIQRATDVTYMGSVNGTLAALEHMRRRSQGVIINLDLAPSLRDMPLQAAENGARAALRAFCNSLRAELLHDADAIRVVTVDLPAINTPRYRWTRNTTGQTLRPAGPVYEPEVAAEAICRAAFTTSDTISVGPEAILSFLHKITGTGYSIKKRAQKGYKAQLSKDYAPDHEADNLYTSPAGIMGAHGDFDSKTRRADSPLSFYIPSSLPAGLKGALLAIGLTSLITHFINTKEKQNHH